tara:strand:+ start:340 stop:3291 length:2952 start_codon:yes stop_codon:yes gene_type:complete
MSSAYAESSNASARSSIGLTALLILSAFGGLLLAPTASATVSGDYEITSSISPRPGDVMTSWDPFTLEVEVTNSGFFFNTESRSIEWFICEGTKDASSCFNQKEDYGTGIIESVPVGQSVNYTFTQTFGSDGDEGPYTLVYRFINGDTNASNDAGIYNFNLSQKLVDVSFESQDILSQLEGVAEYGGELIFNTDTEYNMSLEGVVTSCSTCNLEAGIGWRLINSLGDEVASQSTPYSNLPSWGQSAFTRDMSPLNFSYEGEYTMEYGLISSSGTPSGDMNSYNDIQSVEVIFDDTLDLKITSVFPLNSPTSAKYFYGNDSVSVIISNLGNQTVVEPLVKFLIMDLNENLEYEEDCYPTEILPGDDANCIFDLNKLGDKLLKVQVSAALDEGNDAKPSDNIYRTGPVEVIAGDINPIIDQSEFYGKYNTADKITFSTRTLSTAPGPLTYSWWNAGIIPLGTGQELQVNASSIGLGDHYISVRVTDSLGDMESAVIAITVYNSTNIGNSNWLNGSAVTRTHAVGESVYDYPLAGVGYNSGEDVEALLRFSVDVLPTGGEIDAGMDWMEFDLNLTALLPDNIPRDTLTMHELIDFDLTEWSTLDGENSFELIDNETLRVRIVENMDLLLVGELAPPEVNSGDLELTLLPDGQMQIDWSPTGDLGNAYFGGWNIYRITSPASASAYFPDPSETTSEFVWRGLMQNSLSATLEGEMDTWVDERELETGICASYAIIPIDRAGEPNYFEARVSVEDGNPGLTCGDAIDPSSMVSGMTATTSYNNNTSCYDLFQDWNRCYEVTLSWTWPDHEPEGNITWNLYRIEQRPQDIDLRYIEPIVTGLTNLPGQEGTFTEIGTDYDGVLPYRTYYYILTPLDNIGNEYTIVDYPSSNVERVYVEEEYWDYNEYRIPEPPAPEEPPYGIQWLGDLEDYMQTETFQIAGMVMLLTVLINFIGLPLILKKRKKMKRVLAKRAGKQTAKSDDDFEDFFN